MTKFMSAFVFISLMLAATVSFADGYVVIVNGDNSVGEMDRRAVKKHYLKQKRSWGAGDRVLPVDLSQETDARDLFFESVLKMSAADVKRYWIQKQYQSAIKGPEVKDDEGDIVAFVAREKGAIAFVSKEMASTSGVKIVMSY